MISLGSGLGSTNFCGIWERAGWFSSAWLSCMGTFQTLRVWACPCLLFLDTSTTKETAGSVSQLSYLLHPVPCISDSLAVGPLDCFLFSCSGVWCLSYGHCCSWHHFQVMAQGARYSPISLDLSYLAVENMENHFKDKLKFDLDLGECKDLCCIDTRSSSL